MEKLLSLLILTISFTIIIAIKAEPEKNYKEATEEFDLGGNGTPEITITPGQEGNVLIDLDDDGTPDVIIKKSRLKKLLKNKYIAASCIIATIVYGTDYTLKFFDIEIPLINYAGGDLTTATLKKLGQYSPEVWIFIKEIFPKLWNKFSTLQTKEQ